MFCSRCGKEIDDDATFCTFCGQPQEQLPGAGSSDPDGAPESIPIATQVVIGVLKGADTEIAFANGMFVSNGQTLKAQKLADLDGLGLIDWKSDEMKLLALSQANQSVQAVSALTTPGNPPEPASVPASPVASVLQQKPRGFTGTRDGHRYLNGIDISTESAYWQEELTKMYESNGAYTGKFNWAAFFGSWIWAFVKGLPEIGGIGFAVSFVIGIFTYGIAVLPVSIWLGIRGNYIRYKRIIEQEKIYI